MLLTGVLALANIDTSNQPTQKESEMYTAQMNAHGNVIVCKGCEIRNSYHIIYTGSYNDCLTYK